MLNFVLMIGFSLYLAGYGYVALFKPEWLVNVRAFSARLEGKEGVKREDMDSNIGQARRVMAIASLVLGVIGVILSIATLVIFIASQNGAIAV